MCSLSHYSDLNQRRLQPSAFMLLSQRPLMIMLAEGPLSPSSARFYKVAVSVHSFLYHFRRHIILARYQVTHFHLSCVAARSTRGRICDEHQSNNHPVHPLVSSHAPYPVHTSSDFTSPLQKYFLLAVPPNTCEVCRVDVKRDLGIFHINTLDQHHHACRGTFLLSRSFILAGLQTPS